MLMYSTYRIRCRIRDHPTSLSLSSIYLDLVAHPTYAVRPSRTRTFMMNPEGTHHNKN